MPDDIANLVLEHLRHIRGRIDFIAEEIGDMKLRITALEGHVASQQLELVQLNRRMDRLEERVGRIERRLDLVEV